MYFENKPELSLKQDELLAFSCVKDERQRLPYFFDYYRSKGVSRFFVIDNNSTDGTHEFLVDQPDVLVFPSNDSYKGSGAGRDMLYELCSHYGIGHWCLTVDVDELLVFPGSDHLSIPTLCEFLDLEGSQGLFTVFLDFYSSEALSDTIYEPGTSFFETCPYFETDSYRLGVSLNAPYVSISGGPRWRTFWSADGSKRGPAMRKVPLVKWDDDFRYLYSTHSHSEIPLATVTGVLAHFKFFSFFKRRAENDNVRGDRRQSGDYERYEVALQDDPCFLTPYSQQMFDTRDLLRAGLMACPDPYRTFTDPVLSSFATSSELAMPEPRPQKLVGAHSDRLTVSAMSSMWPFFASGRTADAKHPSNRRLMDFERLVRFGADKIGYEWLTETSVCFAIPEEVHTILDQPEMAFELRQASGVHERFRFRDLQKVTRSLIPNLYQIELQQPLLVDEGCEVDLVRLGTAGYPKSVSSQVFQVGAVASDMSGACERIGDGEVFGWLRNRDSGSWRNTVVFWVNDFYVGATGANARRPDLDTEDSEARGFEFKVPISFFEGSGPLRLSARSRRGGYELRRSPIDVLDTPQIWDKLTNGWIPAPAPE